MRDAGCSPGGFLMRASAIFLPCLCLALAASPAASAQKYRVVEAAPMSYFSATQSVLAADPEGNLYGETPDGEGGGVVFELRAVQGYAVKRTLYTFDGVPAALGVVPFGGVTLDRGNILGMNFGGGVHQDGTVFDLGRPNVLSATVLHAFSGPPRMAAIAAAVSSPGRTICSTARPSWGAMPTRAPYLRSAPPPQIPSIT
jgi:hypothetical protein